MRRGDLLAVPGGRTAHRGRVHAIFLLDGPGIPLLRDLLFFSLLIPIAFIDIDHRIIPTNSPSAGSRRHSPFLSPRRRLEGKFHGCAAGRRDPLCHRVPVREDRGAEGMGGGDIKLLAMIGAFVGWRGTLATIFFGALLGATGGCWRCERGGGAEDRDPVRALLCVAALGARIWGGVLGADPHLNTELSPGRNPLLCDGPPVPAMGPTPLRSQIISRIVVEEYKTL